MATVTNGGQALYEHDFAAWLDRQVRLASTGRAADLDLRHLAEELEAMGNNQRREVRSRLTVLLQHLLKARFQPDRWTTSRALTIRAQRRELADLLASSPSLRGHAARVFALAYRHAREDAATETGLPPDRFPETCPFKLEQALDPSFWPAD